MLEDQHLISSKDNFNGRAQRYSQRLCNTPFAEIQFSDAEFAIITLLLLRGPQTPGELRSRGARLFSFSDNVQVVDVLAGLTQREGGPLVIQLPRKAGRQDSEYAHLLSGPIDIDVAFVQVEDNGAEAGLDAILTEVERMRRYGVTVSELERAKQEAVTISKNYLKERDNFDSSSLADDYLEYFLIGTAAPSID